MKKILIGILTIFITILIIVLGVSINLEATIVDTVDVFVKKEVTNTIVDIIEENTNYNREEIKSGIDKVMEEDETIKKTVDLYFDKFMDIMSGGDTAQIDLSKEAEDIINSSDEILKEYGITITEKDKKELLDAVSSEEINDTFNEAINEFRSSIPSEVKTALAIFNFLRSNTFKLMLIGGIILFLALIALLKKSYYKWLGNLGIASLVGGIIYGVLLPRVIDILSEELKSSEGIFISFSAFTTYGYTLIAIGLVSIIINIVLSKCITPKITLEMNE